jgi:hypothetical protein
VTVVVDLVAVRRSCAPIATWWRRYLATGAVDRAALGVALDALNRLGRVHGRLGTAIDFLVAGCPDATYVEAADAFTIVAAAGRGVSLPAVPRSATMTRIGPRSGDGCLLMDTEGRFPVQGEPGKAVRPYT